MSWLLVAFVPGLLMLATFGLQRLESGLVDATLTARDVAKFLQQAEPDDMRMLAREGMPEALDNLHRRQSERAFDELTHQPRRVEYPADPVLATAVVLTAEQQGLPSGRHRHSRRNRQFEAPPQANRV
ncbi:hypothetical protein [Mycobacterium sp.]|uniref:hypothetical protein n=1 Tax=Mycobacterium sp. TaxID=1785 RepID=UPI003D6A5CE2